jgi:hypothetical protein
MRKLFMCPPEGEGIFSTINVRQVILIDNIDI